MLKNLARATTVVVALAVSSGSANALKILDVDFAETTGEHDIHVRYDKDQSNWTTATSAPTSFVLDWRLEVRSLQPIKSSGSYVLISVLGTEGAQGLYTLEETRDNPGITYPDISWTGTKTFEIPGNELLVSSAAVDMCQYLYAQGERPNESHRAYIGQITSRLETQVENYSVAFSKSAVKTVTSDIYAVCDSDPDWTPQAPAVVFDQGEFKTTGIDLFLTTFADATTQPNVATTCKKARILVRVSTSKAGPAKFKLWTQVGNSPITSKVVDAWSSHDGNGAFKAEHVEWVSVGEPTPVQAMAEDMVNSVGQTTQWKDITLQCTGTGGGNGGGLTVGNDEPMLPGLNLTGDFSYVDVGSPKCTRTGKALISFTSNRPDNIHYSLDCTNGQHFSGYVQPVQVPQGGHIAAATQTFQIDKTSVYSCALKTVQPGPVKLHKWKGHTFECVKSTGVSGSADLAPDTQPEPKKPDKPAIATEPSIGCADGQVKNGKCLCRPGLAPVAAGPNDFRCQLAAIPMPLPKLVPPPPSLAPLLKLVPPPKSKPKIACAGGKVSKGKCVCPKGLTPVSAGGSAFRCTRIAQAPAVKTAPKAVIVPKLPDLRKLFGQ